MGRIVLKCIPLFLTLNLVYALPKAGQKTLYDEDEARMLLNMAAASYGKQHIACVQRTYPRDQKRVILGVHREDCDWLSNTCVAFVVHSPVLKELIVVFRGTKTPKQLLAEGWKSLEPGIDFFDMGNVNKYFLDAHLALWPGLEKMVSNKKYADHRIIFTGHSLGGALAALAAARTVLQGYRKSDQVKVVTFGQPRVGSLQFSRKFDEIVPNCFRIVFRRDLVPHLPTCKMIEPERPGEGTSKPCDADDIHAYYHHGVEIWYPDSMDNGSKFIECTGLPHHEDFNCSDQIKFFIDQSDSYLWDHRHYFGKMISGFGKTGCNEAMPEGEDGFFQKALNSINRFAKGLGLN